jgi:hypothetical protein
MTTPLWINDPSILLNKNKIFDLLPSPNMSYEEKVNSITRLIILISILGFIFTMNVNIFFIGITTLAAMFILLKLRKSKITKNVIDEGFTVEGNKVYDLLNNTSKNKIITNPITLESVLRENYKEGTKKNPFSNVLLTDITDDPTRKPAPPCFNVDVDEDITKNVKKSVQFMNPEIKNTNKQLFSSLTDNFYLDQSNRAFFSTANTKIPNDQKAYGEFLYGNMPSAKESNVEGNLQRIADNYRYTLY